MISTTSGLLFYRPLPTIDGHYRLLGLHARGEVIRDDLGIPRVYAGDIHDLFFLQGYVTAQDRLAQMEAMRTSARARRGDAARVSADRAAGDLRVALDAYAEGVTKFIEQHAEHRALPAEIALSGKRPVPWSADDPLAILASYLGPPSAGSTCVGLGRDRTFKGVPLLAAELRLDAPAPGLYEIGLEGRDIRAIGLSLPGVPGILAGHNGWIGWALVPASDPPGIVADPVASAGGLLVAARSRTATTLDALPGVLSGCAADIHGRIRGVAPAREGPDASVLVSGPGTRTAELMAALRDARAIDIETMRTLLGRPAPADAAARIVVDLADVDASKAALSTGQSAHRASRHHADQAPLWEAGRLHRLGSSRGALGRIEGQLVFRAR
jgi:acyl-homoserine lactone acylase PvdQ